MKISRDITSKIVYLLDNWLPPALRDCYPLMYPIYRLASGKNTAMVMKYREHYPFLSDEEYSAYYALTSQDPLAQRPTDLNRHSIQFVLSHAQGSTNCLDVGCGRGWLAQKLAETGLSVTGLDIGVPPNYSSDAGYSFVEGSVEKIPFPDNAYDTVICAHVLEHVRDFDLAVKELFRVTKRKLIIVLPCQREYRYSADLHIRYFPYLHNVQMAFPQAMIEKAGMDWGIVCMKHSDT